MIRYDTDAAKLLAAITAIDAKWETKTKARTKKFIKAGAFAEKSSLWSTVKPVYMRLQWFKCVFCERQFENERYGKIEFDVEHFRPKSSVLAWPSETVHPDLAYDFATGAASASGYYWLAYDVENYAASCKACNSALKSNYFPIAGDRGATLATVAALAAEEPYLCYPLGDGDDDPEDLLTFVATTATPKAADGHARRRGQVMIDFFDLNGRDLLHRQRAQMISMFGGALAAVHAGTASPTDEKVVAGMSSPALPHASCVRAFRSLYDADPDEGQRVFERCREVALSQTMSAPPDL